MKTEKKTDFNKGGFKMENNDFRRLGATVRLGITVEVLTYYDTHIDLFCLDDDEIKSLHTTLVVMQSEYEHLVDQEAHCDVTLDGIIPSDLYTDY